MARDGRGWRNESARHAMASKGIKSARKVPTLPRSPVPRFVAIQHNEALRQVKNLRQHQDYSFIDSELETGFVVDEIEKAIKNQKYTKAYKTAKAHQQTIHEEANLDISLQDFEFEFRNLVQTTNNLHNTAGDTLSRQ